MFKRSSSDNIFADLVLLDALMPHLDGVQATREIKARWPEVRVIALVLDWHQRALALEAGADAWVLKGRSSEELLSAIQGLNWETSVEE